MSINNITQNLENTSSQGIDWSLIQRDMKNKLGTDIYDSWLRKIDFIEEMNNYVLLSVSTRFIRDYCGEEDYAILENYKKEQTTANVIASTENIENNNNILCYIENGRISSIKEDGIEIFKFSNNQFLSNLNNSKFFIAKGKTIAVEDFNLRTKLLTLLSRINQKPKDFKKIIKIYYENPVAVLKKAGLL